MTAFALLVTSSIASAAPRHVLVLRAEGNADAATRANVDQQVTRLARSLDDIIEPGEITFADAAAAVGCSGSEAQCRDDVLGMLGVDELVATSVAALPNGDLHVTVHRIPKGAATRDAQTTVPKNGALDAKITAEIGPMFGIKPKPGAAAASPAPPPPAPTGAFGNDPVTSPPSSPAVPIRTAQLDRDPANVTAAPNGSVSSDRSRGSRAVTGLAIGGGLVVLSVILWAEAGSVQSDINRAPTLTTADFKNLKDLESKGDAYSGLGNLTFIGGLVVGAISGYFYYQDRRAASAQARIVPTLVDHGVGLAFTYGGRP